MKLRRLEQVSENQQPSQGLKTPKLRGNKNRIPKRNLIQN